MTLSGHNLLGPQSCDGIIVILSYVHTSSITHASPSLLESVQGGNMRIFTFKQRCLFVSTMRCLIKQCFLHLQELFHLEAESSRVWGKSRSLVLVSVWVIIWSRSGENRILYKTLIIRLCNALHIPAHSNLMAALCGRILRNQLGK